jgi:hypothetical protein
MNILVVLRFRIIYGDRMVVELSMQLALITTNVESSDRAHGEVYSIQHYVIKFVSDLRQFGGFLCVLRFSRRIILTSTI